MSKNQSRKGYVVGALVALVSTLFTVAPAQANNVPDVNLLPTLGSTYNTLIGSPISLKSSQNPTTVATDRTAAEAWYIISNPAGSTIRITFAGATENTSTSSAAVGASFSYLVYNSLGTAVSSESYGTNGTLGVTVTSSSAISAGNTYKTLTITTAVKKIAVPAWRAANSTSAPTLFNDLVLDTPSSSTVNLTVQTLIDMNDDNHRGVDAGRQGVQDADLYDLVSAERSVSIFAPGEVSAVTNIEYLVPEAVTASTKYKATVVYGSSVNPWFVSNSTYVSFFRNGSLFKVDGTTNGQPTYSKAIITATSGDSGLEISRNVLTVGVDDTGTSNNAFAAPVNTGVYSAQAYYDVDSREEYDFVTMGAASTVVDLTAGPTDRMDGLSLSHTATLDSSYTQSANAETLSARSGTRTLSLTAQIWENPTKSPLAFANVEVKAVVSEVALDAGTTITVTGAAGSLKKDGDPLTALGRTDSTGKATFTINSTTGKKGDHLNVDVYAKDETGTWIQYDSADSAPDGVNVVWEDGRWTSFTAKPATYVSGTNPTVTFKVADQFGKGLDTIDGKALTVYTVASFGGVDNAKSYSGTAVVANGEAKFTFANFAPAGGLAQLKATLYEGALNNAAVKDTEIVNVYNTAATDKITVVQSFDKAVTYKDYVTGDTTDPAVAKKVSDAGLSTGEGVTITGNVLNTAGVGQPGVAVVVAAKDVLFYADGVYALDTITTNANEFGAFSVVAISQKVNVAGHTVSITADGKTTSTLFKTYLPSTLDAKNLKFSWTLPATVVKNTTYAVTLSLTDKWGNPVAGSTTSTQGAVSVQGFGSVEINSVPTAVNRNFDRNGQVTVFLRSVKDIAGPGSIQATLQTTGWTYPTNTTGVNATVLGEAGNPALATIITTNDTSTAWDERTWTNVLTSNIEVLDTAPASTAGKVNVGSFNGKLVVYAQNLDGARISWKVGGNWGKATAVGNTLNRFDRPTPRRGVTVSVEIYVNGVLQLTKSVVTR